MVTIKRKKVGKITYYYLQHSVRKGSKVQSKEIYLGRKIPRDIEEIKGKLLKTIYEKEWYPLLDRIKEKPFILKEKGHLFGYYSLFHLEDTILALRQ